MLRFFRSISRGRRKGDNEDTWSPFASSPERPRHRAVGRARHQTNIDDREYEEHDDDNHDDHDDDHDDHDDDEFSPRRPLNTQQDYFGRPNHYQDYDDLEEGAVEDEDGGEDEDAEGTPLLPIFSAAHLDRLPLYNITHAIRQLIVARCETTLSWDQLRSPQISQFLVKPIQGQIRADHFNRATLCALIANCLQFQKEGQMSPGNVGVSRTRAAISELLAMRLLRDYSTRELIDSLSYDFDPLQGMSSATENTQNVTQNVVRRPQGRVARVSTIEIAIRAEAKRFLAHPLVVQHLEAIWAGNIVFHSEADNLHRRHRQSEEGFKGRMAGYGTNGPNTSALPADSVLSRKAHSSRPIPRSVEPPPARRAVTLYNPKDASLFKLSRLRVPRYRQVFSTVSFAIMLALFVAVLADRNLVITPLEVLFWFWSIGYMLDEVVGFTEQGFGLYILSFWNAFDLGILVLFVIYYCLRLYGIVLADEGKHRIAGIAYDVLAATAILLFPRLFSVLDHYKYFSQLLIAFRLMAMDLMAVLVLIVISCSGFFVALSLSFADTRDANGVAYSLFQILMGFTPAVWDHWAGYNFLGKAIMVIFLCICHFLVVTILITVLTNSFMAIVKNAEEEHQFLFAVNTISMVKSDALFSYVAPTNVVGWMLSPLRFLIPLRSFVKFNRTIIKISHFPILFTIFAYERMIMARSAFAPAEWIERQPVQKKQAVAFSGNKAPELYTPSHRLREPSVISFNKDRALDEVFRRPFQGDTLRTTTQDMDVDRRKSTAVDHWMETAENEGGASPPLEEPRSVLERLEHRRPNFRRANTGDTRRRMMKPSREFSTATRSVASDPDLLSLTASRWPNRIEEEPETSTGESPQDTEADGDDEINESEDNATPALGESALSIDRTTGDESESEFFQTPVGPSSPLMQLSHAARARIAHAPEMSRAVAPPQRLQGQPRKNHNRQTSSGTILFAPEPSFEDSSTSNPARPSRAQTTKRLSAGSATPPAASLLGNDGPSGTRTPGRKQAQQTKARPIMPPRQKTAPKKPGLTFLDMPPARRRDPSFNARALDLASDLGDNKFSGGGIDAGGISGMPASFSEQMMRERELERRAEEDRRRSEEEEKGMVNRIMLARMHTLEEGFREVLKEIKDLSQTANSGSRRDSEADAGSHLPKRPSRPKVEPSTSAVGDGTPAWQPPKTPIGRIGGNEKSKKVSPRKAVTKKKEKENEFPRSGSAGDLLKLSRSEVPLSRHESLPAGGGTASPDSVQSVVEIPREEVSTRPPTAYRTEHTQKDEEDEQEEEGNVDRKS
ncbi:related to integral membrane channel [Lecanosticta acicola]|uniref:Related to integral membrane channel n=1 Tax=Lecanosticta acicola TaxID=111012 RepID=A0AAI8Z0W7_9PEZI|nr:related to integral membrane channel [Lecanosticta acicola]